MRNQDIMPCQTFPSISQAVISNACKVQDFRILPRDFSVKTGEFTPTMKLKRSVAAEMWAKEIAEMYPE